LIFLAAAISSFESTGFFRISLADIFLFAPFGFLQSFVFSSKMSLFSSFELVILLDPVDARA
jgi:hypothetical protein